MRHQRLRNTLGLRPDERSALLATLATALARRGRIETTVQKAKALQRFVEPLVTLAKRNTLHSHRQLISQLKSSEAAGIFLKDVVPSLNGRTSGYTRIIRYRYRIGDGAETALIEFTDPITREKSAKPKKEKKKEKSVAAAPAEEVKKLKKQKSAEEKAEKRPESPIETPKAAEAEGKEKPKKGGFLGGLRKFLKGED